jgi:hypothetical protein
MSYDKVLWGNFGDEKVTSSTKVTALGTLMIMPDGREFVYARASATALVAGNLYQGNGGIVTSDADYKATIAVVSGGAAGSNSVVLTAGGTTAVTTNLFADGVLSTASSVGTGVGYLYKIKSCSSAAASGNFTVNTYESDPFKVALAAATTTVGLRENEFYSVTLTTADTVGVGVLAGVAPTAVTASYYCWLQRKGRAAVKGDGTLVIGLPVVPSAALAGAVAPFATAAADTAGVRAAKGVQTVGMCENVAASLQFSVINLMIP